MLLFLLVVYLTLDLAGYDVPYDVLHDASNFKKRGIAWRRGCKRMGVMMGLETWFYSMLVICI